MSVTGGRKPPAVFLDLDGTLLDTSYFHTVAWWRALDEAGVGRPMCEIHELIGMGSSELLARLIGDDNNHQISKRHGEFFASFHDSVRALPGADDLIQAIKDRGGEVVVVTSATERDLGPLLGALKASELIDVVVHGEAAEEAKPSPQPFRVALERSGRDPSQAIAIGDSVWDVEAAAGAGVGCIGVGTGGIWPLKLEHAGAVGVYESCKDLLEHWDTSALGDLVGPLIK
jgi:HAD superfamily hydrolase (TIGR01509 family)